MPRGRIPGYPKVRPMPEPKYKHWPSPVDSMDNPVILAEGYMWLGCSCCGRVMPCRIGPYSRCIDCRMLASEIVMSDLQK